MLTKGNKNKWTKTSHKKKNTFTFPTLLAEERLQSCTYPYTSVCSFVLHLVKLQCMAVSRCVGVTRCFHRPEPLVSFLRCCVLIQCCWTVIFTYGLSIWLIKELIQVGHASYSSSSNWSWLNCNEISMWFRDFYSFSNKCMSVHIYYILFLFYLFFCQVGRKDEEREIFFFFFQSL